MSRDELDALTGRDLELCEIALDSAIMAVGQYDKPLRAEYEHALDAIVTLQNDSRRER